MSNQFVQWKPLATSLEMWSILATKYTVYDCSINIHGKFWVSLETVTTKFFSQLDFSGDFWRHLFVVTNWGDFRWQIASGCADKAFVDNRKLTKLGKVNEFCIGSKISPPPPAIHAERSAGIATLLLRTYTCHIYISLSCLLCGCLFYIRAGAMWQGRAAVTAARGTFDRQS